MRSDSAVKRKTKNKKCETGPGIHIISEFAENVVLKPQRLESRTCIAGSSDKLLNAGLFLRHPGSKQDCFSFLERIDYNGFMTTDYILAQGSTQTCMSCVTDT